MFGKSRGVRKRRQKKTVMRMGACPPKSSAATLPLKNLKEVVILNNHVWLTGISILSQFSVTKVNVRLVSILYKLAQRVSLLSGVK